MVLGDPDIAGLVLDVLIEAQVRGFIGPGDLTPHLSHSLGFAAAVARVRRRELDGTDWVADLGTGGGLPGLVLAAAYRDTRFVFIEGSTRRAEFLRGAVDHCGLSDEVEVLAERAEIVGHSPTLRGGFSIVLARLLGSPPEVGELASPLLRVGGHLVVSEPPGSAAAGRWPASGVAELGLNPAQITEGFAVLEQMTACPDRYPRRTGIPRKRPLF